MTDSDFENEKRALQKDLEFYLEYYKELSSRSEQMKIVIDLEIAKLIEKLKEIGK